MGGLGFDWISTKINTMLRVNFKSNLTRRIIEDLLLGLCIAGLCLAVSTPAFGSYQSSEISLLNVQTTWPAIGEAVGYLRFEHLGVREGLSENAVLAIWQDSQGFLWFGTREGLNKFDGYHFSTYQADKNDPGALFDAHITAIAETEDGALWLGTYFGGLARFDRNSSTFETYLPDPKDPSTLPDARVNALLVDSMGRLWVGTRGGLSMLSPGERRFVNYRFDVNSPESSNRNAVRSLHEDQSGNLWVGTYNGLLMLSAGEVHFKHFLTHTQVANISSICGDGSNGLWLGTSNGLVHFNTEIFSYRIYWHDPEDPGSLSSDKINVVFRDRKGRLWIGFEDRGVNLVSDADSERLQIVEYAFHDYDKDSLSHNEVTSIYEDRGGVMWIGTRGGGINKTNLASRAFGYFRHHPDQPSSLAGDHVTALAFDLARQSLWVGTAGVGLDRLDLTSGEFNHYRHDPEEANSLSSNYVTLLHISAGGDLYVATEGGSLQVYDAALGGFLTVFSETSSKRAAPVTTAITQDHEGILWVSQTSGELIRFDPASSVVIRYDLDNGAPQNLQDALILDIYADRTGIIWLGTENQGLVSFDPQKGIFSVFRVDGTTNSPNHNSITNIYEDENGRIWLGTDGGGLNRYHRETGTFTYYTNQDGLPSNRVFGILEDELGYLWLSTGNGLVQFSPELGVRQNFDTQDGLQGSTFTRNAYAKADDGALFFGGINGLNAFYPDLIKRNDHVPPVVITSVSLYGQVLARDIQGCSAELTLAHDQNFLSFEFAALDFNDPSDNQYAYILEGLNENYVLAGNRRFSDFPNLAPGTYTFRLLGSNNDAVWNSSGACIRITIQPPFWGTWWFIGLIGLILAASVIGGYHWRLNNIERQRQRLTVEVFERTEEIERRRQMAIGLSDVIRLLNTNQPLEMSLDFIVKQAVGLTEASKAAIFKRQDQQVIVQACYPAGETYCLDLNNPYSTSARCLLESTFLNRLLIFSRIDPKTMQSDNRWELVSGDYHTAMCTPLLVDGEVYGGLVMYYGEERIFTPDEINLAHTLADHTSLAIANDRLKNKAQATAVTAERNRLARDLHDAVTQTLFSASLIADVIPKIWQKSPQQAYDRLNELQQLTRGALGEMRTLLMELRPAALDEADPVELFKHLSDAFTGRTGVPVHTEMDVLCEFQVPHDIKLVFYRIAQEGLNNILKHANATQVWLYFKCDAEEVVLSLQDDGQGCDPINLPPGHMGIGIMQERAEAVGAEFTFASQPGAGTHLRLIWHIEENTIK